ncbi:MAG: hypothetical protein EZS28_008632 [Streblomastix strix]|uniref:Uncharacterized protein n=1 Tax=Streblomastix strix TaxID=222440 RepID=A0A5J4WMN9_9EUKA|nr:MAG: hypothetical protein EZS28_008632 [Streblomastix strix]
MNLNMRQQQNLNQPIQLVNHAITQAIERRRLDDLIIRSINNLLITPVPAYSVQQTSRIAHLLSTTERDQQRRRSKRSITPTHWKTDESEEDDFLDEIIPVIIMLHLPPHQSDIETAQRTLQNRGYDLVRDPSVIKYKNMKQQSKLAKQKLFTFRDWREFWSDAGFSLEQINMTRYLLIELKSKILHENSMKNEAVIINEKEKEKEKKKEKE